MTEDNIHALENGINETNETWDKAQQDLADALHAQGLKWGVIKDHLDSDEFKEDRFEIEKMVEQLKNCKKCMAGKECPEHKIKFKDLI